MQVESYEVTEETINGKEQATDPEALEIIEKLNLVGQQRFVGKNGSGIEARAPYRLITKLEYRVYAIIMPDRASLETYNGQMIPVRVLRIAEQAKASGLFRRLEVWHQEGKDDPVLIGSDSTYDYSRPEQRNTFILARWGDVLKPFPELIEDAKKIVAGRFAASARAGLRLLQEIAEEPELYAENFIRNGGVPETNSFYQGVS